MPAKNYAVRISDSWESLRQTVGAWALKAERILCYEHSDDGAARLHCHLLLWGVHDTVDNLKVIARGLGIKVTGNKGWTFKTTFKDPKAIVHDIDEQTYETYVTYMSKGKYEPKYVKGYEQKFLDDAKNKWIEFPKRMKCSHEKMIYEKFKKHMIQVVCELHEKGIDETELNEKIIKRNAFQVAMEHHGVISVALRKDVKMMVDTWLWSHDKLNEWEVALPFESLPERSKN